MQILEGGRAAERSFGRGTSEEIPSCPCGDRRESEASVGRWRGSRRRRMTEGAAAAERGGGIHRLPEGCVSHVLSLTSPRDACRSAAVSWTFRSAAESDAVWERFLPPDYREIVSRAVAPVECTSKRELYFRLCGSVLVDEGTKSFALERSSGKKCLMMSARELVIVWGDTPAYWRWVFLPESRFSEVAELLGVCWLEIRGVVDCRMLSQDTAYLAYLIFKLTEDSYGLGFPQEGSIKLGAHTAEQVVCLQPEHPETRWPIPHLGILHVVGVPHPAPMVLPQAHMFLEGLPPPPAIEQEEVRQVPQARDDGWMEIEIGEFFNDKGEAGVVEVCFMEIKGGHWKHGLIVEGIEMRPRR